MKDWMRLASVVLGVMSPLAMASIPPSQFIVKQMAAKHATAKGIRVRSLVSEWADGKESALHFRTSTWIHPQNGTVRTYALDDSGRKLYSVERRPETAPLAQAVMFWSSGRHLAFALKARGIEVKTDDELSRMSDESERQAAEISRLERFNDHIAWVIGTKDRSRNVPQLWVEKDTFLPLILIARSDQEGLYEVDFEGHKFFKDLSVPLQVTVKRDGVSTLKDEVQDVAFAADPSEFKGVFHSGFTELGQEVSPALKKLIQSYFEVLR